MLFGLVACSDKPPSDSAIDSSAAAANEIPTALTLNASSESDTDLSPDIPATAKQLGIQNTAYWDQKSLKYNLEAIIPPQCYTRTEGQYNPCYTCHQSYPPFYGEDSRPNDMRDGDLQAEYAFSDEALQNHWKNLFVDRRDAVAQVSDAQILQYVNDENYIRLQQDLEAQGFTGFIPDLENYHLGAAAFDSAGLALDGSHWVAFNYKPLPSTFWPTNGSTDDVLVRLPACFREDASGQYQRDIYLANLGLLEIAIQDLTQTTIPEVDESVIGIDIDNDGVLGITDTIQRREYYLCSARDDQPLTRMLYPEGTEFLHSVRYVGVDAAAEIFPAARMKELRYMKKTRFFNQTELRSIYSNERGEKIEAALPN